ncbi:hypothetical protein ACHAXH_002822 [Discostella pseudostelligera]
MRSIKTIVRSLQTSADNTPSSVASTTSTSIPRIDPVAWMYSSKLESSANWFVIFARRTRMSEKHSSKSHSSRAGGGGLIICGG